jgi:hypothetical protein
MPKLISVAMTTLLASLTPMFATAGPLPLLSGQYALTYNEVCQADSNDSDPGSISTQTLYADFQHKTVLFEGNSVAGALVVWQGDSSGLTKSSINQTWPYSNDGTTITINGVVYGIAYGPSKARNGLVYSAMFGGISKPGCAVNATMIRR